MVLDSYYLQLERKFKMLYDIVRQKAVVEFDLNIQDINYKKTKDKKLRYLNCLFATCEWLFYMPLMIILTFIFQQPILSFLNDK